MQDKKRVSVDYRTDNQVVSILRSWSMEANSGHNDGWVQGHYREKINEVRGFLKSLEDER